MSSCSFCDHSTYQGSQFKLSPDPDHPPFLVCDRKACTRQRSKKTPEERLAGYTAWQERKDQERAASEARHLAWQRDHARGQRLSELSKERIRRFGEDAVKFAAQLASGAVTMDKVSQAQCAADEDAASVAALSDTEVDELTARFKQQEEAHKLKWRRIQLSGRPWRDDVVFGLRIGKLSPGHAEVRRQVAEKHHLPWTEVDLPEHGGIQSWFTGDQSDVGRVLGDVLVAETQPISAKHCGMCDKDAGLDYTLEKDERQRRSKLVYVLCARPECVQRRERLIRRIDGCDEPDTEELQKHLWKRRLERHGTKHRPVFYPAPGILEPSSEEQEIIAEYNRRVEQQAAEEAEWRARQPVREVAVPVLNSQPSGVQRMSTSYSYLEKLKDRKAKEAAAKDTESE